MKTGGGAVIPVVRRSAEVDAAQTQIPPSGGWLKKLTSAGVPLSPCERTPVRLVEDYGIPGRSCAEVLRLGDDTDPSEVQSIGIPARHHRRICNVEAIAVKRAGVDQLLHLEVSGVKQTMP